MNSGSKDTVPAVAPRCEACGTECTPGEKDQFGGKCRGCDFAWVEIEIAVQLVDAVGGALGVDIGTVQEDRHQKAIRLVLDVMTDPGEG